MNRIFIFVATLILLSNCAFAQFEALPIKPGQYYPKGRSSECVGSPALLWWDGKSFSADYIYMDNILTIRMLKKNTFELTSETKIDDDNTSILGKVWHAVVTIKNSEHFVFSQFAEGQSPHDWDEYYLCK